MSGTIDKERETRVDQELYCANHPDRPTRVTCSSCGKPICSECMVYAAVGIKCKQCSTLAKSTLRAGKPSQFIGAAVYGVLAAVAGAAVIAAIFMSVPFAGFLGFIIYLGYGYVVGEAVVAGSKGNRGPIFMTIAGVCAAAGLLILASYVGIGGPIGLIIRAIAVFIAASRLSGV